MMNEKVIEIMNNNIVKKLNSNGLRIRKYGNMDLRPLRKVDYSSQMGGNKLMVGGLNNPCDSVVISRLVDFILIAVYTGTLAASMGIINYYLIAYGLLDPVTNTLQNISSAVPQVANSINDLISTTGKSAISIGSSLLNTLNTTLRSFGSILTTAPSYLYSASIILPLIAFGRYSANTQKLQEDLNNTLDKIKELQSSGEIMTGEIVIKMAELQGKAEGLQEIIGDKTENFMKGFDEKTRKLINFHINNRNKLCNLLEKLMRSSGTKTEFKTSLVDLQKDLMRELKEKVPMKGGKKTYKKKINKYLKKSKRHMKSKRRKLKRNMKSKRRQLKRRN